MELIYYPGIRGINTQVTNISLQNTAYSALLLASLVATPRKSPHVAMKTQHSRKKKKKKKLLKN